MNETRPFLLLLLFRPWNEASKLLTFWGSYFRCLQMTSSPFKMCIKKEVESQTYMQLSTQRICATIFYPCWFHIMFHLHSCTLPPGISNNWFLSWLIRITFIFCSTHTITSNIVAVRNSLWFATTAYSIHIINNCVILLVKVTNLLLTLRIKTRVIASEIYLEPLLKQG